MNKIALRMVVCVLALSFSPTALADQKAFIQMTGGIDASMDSYPFAVAVQKGSNHDTFCSGSLIAKRWVLTAAHCVEMAMLYPEKEGFIANPNPLKRKIRVQFNNLAGRPSRQVIAATSWGWFGISWMLLKSNQSDLALLELNSDAPTSPVQIGDAPGLGENLTELGYGPRSPDLETQSNLGKGNVVTGQPSACSGKEIGGSAFLQVNPRKEFCTKPAPTNGAAACQGDSGGPALNPSGQLVGVASWGLNSGGCSLSLNNRSAVFARADMGLEWIRRQSGLALGGRPALTQDRRTPRYRFLMQIKGRYLLFHTRSLSKSSSGQAAGLNGFVLITIKDPKGRKKYEWTQMFTGLDGRILIPRKFFQVLRSSNRYIASIQAATKAGNIWGNGGPWQKQTQRYKMSSPGFTG